jgi:hypothetical protein
MDDGVAGARCGLLRGLAVCSKVVQTSRGGDVVAAGFRINPWVSAVAAPPIPEAQGWRGLYEGRHGPLIDLSQAVPGNPPPEAFLERVSASAADPNESRYGPILGDTTLREAHAAETARLYGGDVGPGHVAITSGCNQAFVVAMMALARAGDAVILPAPWYFNHRMTLDMLGIEARVLPLAAADGFLPDPDVIATLIDERVRAVVLVSPNNPTGAVYPPERLAAIAEVARRAGIALVLDETYRDLLPLSQARAHALFEDPEWSDTVIQLYSFSKAHAIPGWRLGSIIAGPAVIAEIEKILDSLQICPPRAAQAPVAWAIAALADWRMQQRAELAARADVCRAVFAAHPGWRLDAAGAYFAFVAHPFTGRDARAVGRALAGSAGVLALPGTYFGPGLESHLRFAFANVDRSILSDLAPRLRLFRL